jgi:hypothetical protein
MRLLLGLTILCFLVIRVPESPAAGSITEYVLPQPDSPIQLTNCKAGVQFSTNRWGTNSSLLTVGADFRNVSSKTAIEIVVGARLSNALGRVMDTILNQSTGKFSPGAEIGGNTWSQTDSWPGLGEVRCSVARVLFSDGTDWNAPAEAPSPSPAP